MILNSLPVNLTDPGGGQKVKILRFKKMVVSHIKLKGMTNAVTCKHIYCPYTHPRPLGRGQRSNIFFSKSSHVAYQMNWNGA